MSRILAIDYGTKRTGLAVTDVLQISPGALCSVATSELLHFLSSYFSKENVSVIVIGYPLQPNGKDTATTQAVRGLHKQLVELYPEKEVVLQDERYTSVMAHRAILEAGIRKKRRREDKGLVDEISATIILQSYMNRF